MRKKSVLLLLTLLLALSLSCGALAAPEGAELTEELTELSEGSYQIPAGSTVCLEETLRITGKVTLTLGEGAVLTDGDEVETTLLVEQGAELSLYGADSSRLAGTVVLTGGTLNLYSGCIDCEDSFYCCVDAGDGSVFNLYGGTLTASSLAVNVMNASLNMTGGSITGSGTGISSYEGELVLLGGSISGNETGVSPVVSQVTVGGSLRIADNTEADYELGLMDTFTVSETDAPAGDMHMGISLGIFAPACGEETVLEGIPVAFLPYMSSNDHGCYIKEEDGVLKVVNRIISQPDSWEMKFEISAEGYEDSTVEYSWYRFEPVEVGDDARYVTLPQSDEERYADTTRTYDGENKRWLIENPINDEAYDENFETAADLLLHVPAGTYVTLHGVLKRVLNQYAVELAGEDLQTGYGSYGGNGVDVEGFTEAGGDLRLQVYYYPDYGVSEEEKEAAKDVTPLAVISHLTFWILEDTALGQESQLSTEQLEDGYYLCRAVVKSGDSVVDSFISEAVYFGSQPDYSAEDEQEETEAAAEAEGSLQETAEAESETAKALPAEDEKPGTGIYVALGAGAAAAAVAVVLLLRRRKKETKEA